MKYNETAAQRSLENYSRLCDIAGSVGCDLTSLKRGMKSVLIDGRTLLRHLEDPNVNLAEFLPLCEKVIQKVKERKHSSQAEIEERRGIAHNIAQRR